MIPHRALADQIFGNELHDRVTACRKRLRVRRVGTGTGRLVRRSEMLTTLSGAEFPADSLAVRQSPTGVQSTAVPASETERDNTFPAVEEVCVT
jgi:hypothetical protein